MAAEISSLSVGAVVTPSDSTDFSLGTCRALYVGGGGNIVAIIGGTAITFHSVAAGSLLWIAVTRVNFTNTTATKMVALY